MLVAGHNGAAILALVEPARDLGVTTGTVDGCTAGSAIGYAIGQIDLCELGLELLGGDPTLFEESPHAPDDQGELIDACLQVLDAVGMAGSVSDGCVARQ